jgi:hypothetical protein
MISYYPYILLSLTLTPPQSLQDAVDILDDYYCTDNVTGDPYVDFNCTAYFDAQYQHGGTNLTRRDLGFGTNAVSVPQIYRWRRGSVITISVARNNKGVYMDLNAGIAFAAPYWVTVRSSQISASAISKAIKYWNAAQIGVQFQFSTDLTKSTYVTKTGGTKGIALATAEYPAQEGGHQHLINVWDSSLELKWQPVGPNIISHELGHALGLAHNDQTTGIYQIWDGAGDSIMGSTVDSASNIITAIPDRDATGAYLLYNQLNPPHDQLRDDRYSHSTPGTGIPTFQTSYSTMQMVSFRRVHLLLILEDICSRHGDDFV